jgi:hypothetical protein
VWASPAPLARFLPDAQVTSDTIPGTALVLHSSHEENHGCCVGARGVCRSGIRLALHKKPHKDPRVVDHPKAMHQKNPHLKEIQKHKVPKHNTGH